MPSLSGVRGVSARPAAGAQFVVGTGAPSDTTVGRVVGNFSGTDYITLPAATFVQSAAESFEQEISFVFVGDAVNRTLFRIGGNNGKTLYATSVATGIYVGYGASGITLTLTAGIHNLKMRWDGATQSLYTSIDGGAFVDRTTATVRAEVPLCFPATLHTISTSSVTTPAQNLSWDYRYSNGVKSCFLPLQDGQGTLCRDASGNGNNGTLTDGTPTDFWQRLDLQPEGARYLDRTTNKTWEKRRVGNFSGVDKVATPVLNNVRRLTLSCKIDAITAATSYFLTDSQTNTGTLRGAIYIATSGYWSICVNGGSRKIDGVQYDGSQNITATTGIHSIEYIWNEDKNLGLIGALFTGLANWLGQIWDVKAYDSAGNLLISLPLREPSGPTCLDASGNGNAGTLTDGTPADFRNTIMWVPVL